MVMGSMYQPLNSANLEIRLLHVDTNSADRTGRIQCWLEHISLLNESPPKYEAISWCWGDPAPSEEIVLDETPFKISPNAEEVLRHLCFEQGHAVVWLDAVCIDQSNIQERGDQVAIMKDVYSRAERVLLWLGNDSDGSAEAALESIDKILVQCRELTKTPEDINSTFYNSQGNLIWEPLDLPHCDWTALRTFFSAPLFFRVWVVQEIVLSKEALCICGRFWRNWDDVSLTAQHLFHRGYWQDAYMGDVCTGIHNVASIWRLAHRGHTFLNWLVEGLFLKTSLPLDKVYGLLGLLRPDGHRQLELKPDYTDRVDVVYTTATRLAIEELAGRAGQLNHLHYAQALVVPDGQEGDEFQELVFPSWVPRYDWTYLPQRSPMVMDAFGNGVTNGLPAIIRPHDPLNPHILSTKGLILSQVSNRSDMLPAEIFAKEDGDLDGFVTGLLSCRSIAQGGGHADEHVAIALTSRRNANRNDALENVDALVASYRRCVAACEQKVSLSSVELDAAVDDYREAMWHGTGNRVFFTTKTGSMGTAHPATKEEDMLAVLFGALVPVVLRADGEGRWRLVGEAYVHGIMEGEHVRKLIDEDRLEEETRWFDIC